MGKIQHGKIPLGQHSTWQTFHPHEEFQLLVGGAESISHLAKQNSNKTIVRVLPLAWCGVGGLLFVCARVDGISNDLRASWLGRDSNVIRYGFVPIVVCFYTLINEGIKNVSIFFL